MADSECEDGCFAKLELSRISQLWKETLERLHGTEESLTTVLQAYRQLQEHWDDRARQESVFTIEATSKCGVEDLDSMERRHADLARGFSEMHAKHLGDLVRRVTEAEDATGFWRVAEDMAAAVEKYAVDARSIHRRRVELLHAHHAALLAGLHQELHKSCQEQRAPSMFRNMDGTT